MLTFARTFCPPHTHPSDTIDWAYSDITITKADGSAAFHQPGVCHPTTWSPTAVKVVASKYLAGHLNALDREGSVYDPIARVSDAIGDWLHADGYTDSHGADAARADLAWLCLHQHLAFNSPVWFNVGVKEDPQTSACFILSLEDKMNGPNSITDVVATAARLFKEGSGVGFPVSALRGDGEPLSDGGTASGPVSFMRLFDATGGVIKSGGRTRRAATMITIDASHPDVLAFIDCKADAEKKAHALIDAGYDGVFNTPGGAYDSILFQNANHSVRVSDAFMAAVDSDGDWTTTYRTSGAPAATVKARSILLAIAEAAWACGDPGMQFDTTINGWHTCPNTDRIHASNPCQPAFATILTPDGVRTFADIDVGSVIWSGMRWTRVVKKWSTGIKPVYRYRTSVGDFVGTENHRVMQNGERVEVKNAHSIDKCPMPGEGREKVTAAIEERISLGDFEVFDITVECGQHTYWTGGLLVSNCSEYMFLNDSACNLASLNLLKFIRDDNTFDTDRFCAAVRLAITAMDVLIDRSSYPTERIEENSRNFRPLGLGYANLGALLMSLGLPYDSDEARHLAAAITSLLSATAYHQSALLAAERGPFAGFAANRDPMLAVVERHASEADKLHTSTDVDSESASIALVAAIMWDRACELGHAHGYRNAQVTVLAPTGTIGFMMDCDTTGIEPDGALIKYKGLVGGGTLKLVSSTVPRALQSLGYTAEETAAIVAHIAERDTIEGAPHLRPAHLPVFDCALKPAKGSRCISPSGHLKMMAAAQPFLSGAISKTVNVPNSATPADIYEIYRAAHRLGLKAVAVYRDGCKRSQPLTTTAPTTSTPAPTQSTPTRRRLPTDRAARTHKFSIGGHEGYITVGFFEDGTPGEVFAQVSKEGSTLSGLLDAWAIAVSIALQHGVPLDTLTAKFSGARYEPSGFTGNPAIPYAASITDYAARFLATATPLGAALHSPTQIQSPAQPATCGDAPPCGNCGTITGRAGTCYLCPNCGTTTGCG